MSQSGHRPEGGGQAPLTDFGFDFSVGYNGSDNFSVLVGYDFLQYAPVGSIGWSDTKKEAASPPPS